MSRRLFSAGLALAIAAAPLSARALVDPTRPPEASAARARSTSDDQLRLSSILVSPSRRIAVINGRTLRVGDRVAGARVLAIDPVSVQLHGPDGRFTLRLAGPPVKRAPSEGAP